MARCKFCGQDGLVWVHLKSSESRWADKRWVLIDPGVTTADKGAARRHRCAEFRQLLGDAESGAMWLELRDAERSSRGGRGSGVGRGRPARQRRRRGGPGAGGRGGS